MAYFAGTKLFCLMLLAVISFAKQPHILFILIDDFGWNDIGYHGSEISTPYMDQLAAEGVKLENYYVQPICTPTRSQLMSGRYQIHTGLQHFVLLSLQQNGLPLEIPTIADKLKEQGYANHIVGKWHLGMYKKEYTPLFRGFDSFFGLLDGGAGHFSHQRCIIYDQAPVCGLDLRDNLEPTNAYNGSYSTEIFADRVCDIVADHAANHSDQPLFMYVPFQAVHTPLEVPEEYLDPSINSTEDRRLYAGMVSAVDLAIKQITDSFKENGLWEDTLTIVSTDNGGQNVGAGNNLPLRSGKASLYEGGIRGVGFVHGNMMESKGTTNYELIHVSDWFPTLLNLAGGNTTDLELDGMDVWDSISNNAPSPRTEILHNIDPLANLWGNWSYSDIFDTRVRAAIRVGDWKLLTGNPANNYVLPEALACFNWTNDDGDINDNNSPDCVELVDDLIPIDMIRNKNVRLFNIRDDPTESEELSENFPEVVEELLERLAFYNSTAVPPSFPPYDPAGLPEYNGGVWGPWVD